MLSTTHGGGVEMSGVAHTRRASAAMRVSRIILQIVRLPLLPPSPHHEVRQVLCPVVPSLQRSDAYLL